MAHDRCVTNLHRDAQQICTDFVQIIWNGTGMDTVGEQLKALRGRTPHTVRTVARFLGFENHSRYSYYEGKRFKGPVPVDLARRLAELFYRSGKVQPHEVLRLAGLSDAEAANEEVQFLDNRHPPAPPQIIQMDVRLPSERSMTEMFVGMLEAVDRPDLTDELAVQLARLLPTALSMTPTELPARGTAPGAIDLAERIRRAAIDDLGLL